MKLQETSYTQLQKKLEELKAEYDTYFEKNLHLNISRGLPCAELLDLNKEMFHVLDENNCYAEDGTDCRQYGVMYGLPECIRLFSELADISEENIVLGGESSLNLMYDQFLRIYTFGTLGEKPWGEQAMELKKEGKKLKWLCPVPGYDCHFNLTEALDFEMISIPLLETGPDMDLIEKLVAEDDSIKGIWCVPQYSNPTGTVYSDDTVERLAKLNTAARDFMIFWDNAYIVHHFYLENYEKNIIKNMLTEAKIYGKENHILYFASTAKITFPGSGVCMVASGKETVAEIKNKLRLQIFSHDKLNQLRHVKYLKNKETIVEHMRKVAAIIYPRFTMVEEILNDNKFFDDSYTWSTPEGGYFITVNSYEGCAKKILDMTEAVGVKVAIPASTYPYHIDPKDSTIRLAPTYPPIEELLTAMQLFCLCMNIVSIEKVLEEREA